MGFWGGVGGFGKELGGFGEEFFLVSMGRGWGGFPREAAPCLEVLPQGQVRAPWDNTMSFGNPSNPLQDSLFSPGISPK